MKAMRKLGHRVDAESGTPFPSRLIHGKTRYGSRNICMDEFCKLKSHDFDSCISKATSRHRKMVIHFFKLLEAANYTILKPLE